MISHKSVIVFYVFRNGLLKGINQETEETTTLGPAKEIEGSQSICIHDQVVQADMKPFNYCNDLVLMKCLIRHCMHAFTIERFLGTVYIYTKSSRLPRDCSCIFRASFADLDRMFSWSHVSGMFNDFNEACHRP